MGMERLQFRNVIINFVKSTLPVDSLTFLDLYWRNMWAVIIFILITVGAAGLMYLSTRAAFGKNPKKKFIELSYAFIPLSLSVYLAENTFRLLKGLFFIAASIGSFFGRIWEFSPDFDAINRLQILLVGAGFIFTLWAGYLISNAKADENEMNKSMMAIGFTAIVYLIIGVKILTLSII